MKALVLIAAAFAVGGLSADRAANEQTAAAGVQAFEKVAAVLSSPRCANCHIEDDAPLQGADGHRHAMNVRRGPDGRGTPAMRCANCHQDVSSLEPHAPPGALDWRLPRPAEPMAWKGLPIGDQCRMLKDPAKNGNRTLAALLEHAEHDHLIVASWNPGPGRSLPPLSHSAFVEQFKLWIEMGAPCPE